VTGLGRPGLAKCNPRSSSGDRTGTSNTPPAPSGSTTRVPSLAKNAAACSWAPARPASRESVRNACGLDPALDVLSLRYIVVRPIRPPARTTKPAVGFGTVWSA
jgi:hypothetical protein